MPSSHKSAPCLTRAVALGPGGSMGCGQPSGQLKGHISSMKPARGDRTTQLAPADADARRSVHYWVLET